MPHPYVSKDELTKTDIIELRDRAKRTLDGLVTSKGIYASVDNGWKGPYHGWFGRDSAIVTDLVCAAVAYGGDRQLADAARQGLAAMTAWQGAHNNQTTGEERGKFPHEIRSIFGKIHKVQHAQGTNQLPWYVDPKDSLLKNWDSADSTALWVLATIRAQKTFDLVPQEGILQSIRLALEWIMLNIKTYDGLVGFLGADQQPNRVYSGLHNQGWKDSLCVYQNDDGSLAPHPIKDVLVNAEAWAALCEASELFVDDAEFCLRLTQTADLLKTRFNSQVNGFLLPDKTYFAQAIDGAGRQLRQLSADVGMSLWASYDGTCIVDPQYIDGIVRRITHPDMFNPRAGIRDYAIGTTFRQGTLYHGSPDTYWPFVSMLVARGLEQFGYHSEAKEIITASLGAVHQLGSNIEMFVETQDKHLVPWHHPDVGQESSAEQAWTAAAVYFGCLFMLGNERHSTPRPLIDRITL